MTNAVNAIPDHVGTYVKSTTQSSLGRSAWKLAFDVILCPRRGRVRAGGDELLAPADTAQALLAHEALDSAAGNDDAFSAQQSPDLAGTADPATEVAVP